MFSVYYLLSLGHWVIIAAVGYEVVKLSFSIKEIIYSIAIFFTLLLPPIARIIFFVIGVYKVTKLYNKSGKINHNLLGVYLIGVCSLINYWIIRL